MLTFFIGRADLEDFFKNIYVCFYGDADHLHKHGKKGFKLEISIDYLELGNGTIRYTKV